MEQTRVAMVEKLERIFAERAVTRQTERMSLSELLYHALVECGSECRLMAGGAMQGA